MHSPHLVRHEDNPKQVYTVKSLKITLVNLKSTYACDLSLVDFAKQTFFSNSFTM